MAKTSRRRGRELPTDETDDVLFNGVVLVDLASGLLWGAMSWLIIYVRNLGTKNVWGPVAWQAFWLVGLIAVMATDLFFRLIAEREQSLPYRLLNSPRGGVLLTMPVWMVSVVALGLALAFSSGEPPAQTRVHIERQAPAEPTVKPVDR